MNREEYLEYAKDYHYRKTYGITRQEAIEILISQGGKCAICEMPIVFGRKSRSSSATSCLDHDAVTGKVRGVLCFNCNIGLGKFTDSQDLLRRAIEYLRRTSSA